MLDAAGLLELIATGEPVNSRGYRVARDNPDRPDPEYDSLRQTAARAIELSTVTADGIAFKSCR